MRQGQGPGPWVLGSVLWPPDAEASSLEKTQLGERLRGGRATGCGGWARRHDGHGSELRETAEGPG